MKVITRRNVMGAVVMFLLILMLLVIGRYENWKENANICDENGGAILNTMLSSENVKCYMWDNGYMVVRNGNFEKLNNDALSEAHE